MDIPKTIGRYALREAIGRGGMGAVYRAWDPQLEREVALKVILPHQTWSERHRARFSVEAKALAQLAEPHVVRVFDVDLNATLPYIVMEYVAGRNLRQVIDTDGPQPISRLIDCACQALAGLAAAHAAGVIHRDIKPGNILLASDGTYRLVDFGLAHREGASQDLTHSGELLGTLRYLPPEVVNGGAPTPCGDVYALGLTLWELAAGRHPVGGEHIDVMTALRLISTPVPSLATVLPGMSADLARWFDQILAHDPAARFGNAAAALMALRLVAPAPDLPLPSVVERSQPKEGAPTVLLNGGIGSASVSGSTMVSGTHRPSQQHALSKVPKRRLRAGFFIKLVLSIWVMSSLATLVAAVAISQRAIADQTTQLRIQLAGLAADATMMVDAEAHGRLAALGEGAAADPAFVKTLEALSRFHANHPEMRFVYSMTALPETPVTGVVAFVCDPSKAEDRNGNGVIDPDEEASGPGSRYDAKQSPALVNGFTQPVAEKEIYTDKWGTWLSGYAPIRTADGRVTGIIGVDLPVVHIERLRQDFMIHSIILLGSTLLAFGAAGWLVAHRMRRPVAALQRGMDAVAAGDLTARVELHTGDEFEDLANSFEHMRRQLDEAQAVRGAFEAFVSRTLSARHGALAPAGGHRATIYLDIERLRAPQIAAVMPRLLTAVFDHGGVVERTLAEGFIAAFSKAHEADCPEERAIRCALVMLAGDQSNGLRVGLDAGSERERGELRAVSLAHANDRLGTDLMVSQAAFAPARSGFFADRFDLGPALGDGFAIKGAVSAR